MENQQIIRLKDDRTLDVEVLTYPIDVSSQAILIELWRTEWTTADYDWLQSMNGDYSQTLRIQAVLGRVDGQAAGTASVCYPCQDAEVSVVGSVLTHPEFRGIGIAEHLTNQVVELSLDAGCRVSYLGATQDPRNVYLRVGFDWWNGGVMRKASRQDSDREKEFFAIGQSTMLREANWGDLPGFTCFVVQPWDVLVLDYPRSLLSGKYVSLERCVSNFPVVYEEVYRKGGVMVVLVGEAAHRILGFGSLTPEPGEARSHKAVIEVCVHDAYTREIDAMIEWLMSAAEDRKIEAVQAFVATSDGGKQQWFKRFGLEQVAQFTGQIRLGGKTVDVAVLEGQVARQT